MLTLTLVIVIAFATGGFNSENTAISGILAGGLGLIVVLSGALVVYFSDTPTVSVVVAGLSDATAISFSLEVTTSEARETEICPICWEPESTSEVVTLECGHRSCGLENLRWRSTCCLCRAVITYHAANEDEEDGDETTTST